MSKSDTATARTGIQNQLSTLAGQNNAITNEIQTNANASNADTQSILPSVIGGYSDISTSGGYDPTVLGGLRQNVNNLTQTGGFDPTAVSGLRSAFGNTIDQTQQGYLQGVGQNAIATGGYDPAQLTSLTGGYNQLAQTGGISDADAQAIRDSATRGVATTGSVLEQEAARKAAATGGYSGSGAAISQIARQLTQTQADATNTANANIAGLRQSGIEAGLAGGSNLASQYAANRNNAINSYASNQQALTGARQAAATGQTGLEASIAGGVQTGTGLANSLEGNVASNKIGGTAGLLNTAGLTSSNTNTAINQILQSYQQTGQISASDLATLQHLASQPGFGTNLLNAVSTLGGTVAGIKSAFTP